MHANIFATWVI